MRPGPFIATALVGLLLPLSVALADHIPEDQIDQSMIYHGSVESFSMPAEVDIESVIAATPEYKEIVKKKIGQGTGKYWILRGEATDRALRAISDVASDTDYDLIAERDYLGSLDPPIVSEDITDLVIEKMSEG